MKRPPKLFLNISIKVEECGEIKERAEKRSIEVKIKK